MQKFQLKAITFCSSTHFYHLYTSVTGQIPSNILLNGGNVSGKKGYVERIKLLVLEHSTNW